MNTNPIILLLGFILSAAFTGAAWKHRYDEWQSLAAIAVILTVATTFWFGYSILKCRMRCITLKQLLQKVGVGNQFEVISEPRPIDDAYSLQKGVIVVWYVDHYPDTDHWREPFVAFVEVTPQYTLPLGKHTVERAVSGLAYAFVTI